MARNAIRSCGGTVPRTPRAATPRGVGRERHEVIEAGTVATSSTSWAGSHVAASSDQRSSGTWPESCSSSTIRTSSACRGDQAGSLASPCTVARSCSSVSPSGRPYATACTPHSYSQPQRARRAVDDHLAVSGIDGAEVEDVCARGAEALQDRGVVGDRAKELQRLHARRHHPPQGLGDVGRVGRLAAAGAWSGSGPRWSSAASSYCFGLSKRATYRLLKSEAQTDRPRPGRTRARLPHRPAHHGRAGPAGPPLGPAHPVGAPRRSRSSFRDLRARCDNMSTSVLNRRLRSCAKQDWWVRRGGYRLTRDGD